jgi:fructan beta-fructosidase
MSTRIHRLLVALPLLSVAVACSSPPPEQSPAEGDISATSAEATYQERYRPQYHFTPAVNWMNDPNGLVHFDGEYHLFYQYNPFGIRWGHMSWGHAVSPDLVHWEHLPVAIPEADNVMAFSGSAVVDWNNTSGFGEGGRPPLIAIYTGHRTDRPSQSQYLAYSTDRGRSWTRYAGNPVLDLGTPEFRDPKVFWYEPEQKWVMVVALPTEHRISLYSSPDLKEWSHMSDFGPAAAVGGIWECPDLFELPVVGNPAETRWVLIVSLNPGSIAGGSGTQYFIGDFDGTRFTSEFPRVESAPVPENSALWADYGADNYAGVSFSDVPAEDGRRVWIGWMSNWNYANDLPTSPWRSAQALPRVLSLTRTPQGLRLVQEPVAELQQLRGEQRALAPRPIPEGTTSLAAEGIAGRAMEIVVELEAGTASEFGLKVRTGEGEETVIGIDPRAGNLFVDRTRSGEAGFHDEFASRQTAPVQLHDGRVRLHVFVDWSSVEVFADSGRTVITDRIFPTPASDGVALYATGGSARLHSLETWPMASIWTAAPAGTRAESR